MQLLRYSIHHIYQSHSQKYRSTKSVCIHSHGNTVEECQAPAADVAEETLSPQPQLDDVDLPALVKIGIACEAVALTVDHTVDQPERPENDRPATDCTTAPIPPLGEAAAETGNNILAQLMEWSRETSGQCQDGVTVCVSPV